MTLQPKSSFRIAVSIGARVVLYGFLGLILLWVLLPSFWPNVTGGVRGRYMRQQKHYADAFKTGDANVPLFAMDWFAPTVHFCRVNKSGKGAARRDVGHAIQAGVSISLDETNLQALVKSINQLPPPPKHSLPVERRIVVGCIRSKQWFRAIYDRADIPRELEKYPKLQVRICRGIFQRFKGVRLLAPMRVVFSV